MRVIARPTVMFFDQQQHAQKSLRWSRSRLTCFNMYFKKTKKERKLGESECIHSCDPCSAIVCTHIPVTSHEGASASRRIIRTNLIKTLFASSFLVHFYFIHFSLKFSCDIQLVGCCSTCKYVGICMCGVCVVRVVVWVRVGKR